jgi:hypothetical protein
MIYLILKDGLGNQLFQYAAARSLADKLNTNLRLDTSSFKFNPLREYSLTPFSIEAEIMTGFQQQLLRSKRRIFKLAKKAGIVHYDFQYNQQGFHFDPNFFKLKNNICIEGYWQSEKYFLPIEQRIRNEFAVKIKADEINLFFLDKIKSVESVSLHVRRGDYVEDPAVNALHGLCSLSYYREAVRIFQRQFNNPYFFIFSDDMSWVKENLLIENSPVEYISHNTGRDYEDLRLMYSCKHNIIANSSFSWWGAWLNTNPEKVIIAPKNWVKGRYHNPDLLPDSWIQLEG